MQNLFSDLEGLRIAIAMEARGRDFYAQAHDMAVTKEQKELFIWLKTEEIHHMERFTKLYNSIKDRKEAQADEYLFDPDTSRYLTVIAEEHVFPKTEPKKQFADLKTIQAVLQAALTAEKDSVLFYDELATHAKYPEARSIFKALKAEEMAHVVKLREMMDAWA